MGKRVVVDQKLCNKVRKLRRAGLSIKETADMLNIGRTTVDRIISAKFDDALYAVNVGSRRADDRRKRLAEEQKAEAAAAINEEAVKPHVSTGGQLQMDLQIDQEKTPTSYQEALAQYAESFGLDERDKKLMRFEAGQVDKICARLDKIYDLLGQALRRMDNAGTRDIQRPAESQENPEEKRRGH